MGCCVALVICCTSLREMARIIHLKLCIAHYEQPDCNVKKNLAPSLELANNAQVIESPLELTVLNVLQGLQ